MEKNKRRIVEDLIYRNPVTSKRDYLSLQDDKEGYYYYDDQEGFNYEVNISQQKKRIREDEIIICNK